jgi:hypothetical protein
MNENKKFNEAKHFFEQMKTYKMNRDIFEHNLSAFLTSSRTVFQYALKDAENKDGGKFWYDKQVSSSSIIKFLKDNRDINIHSEPITTQAHHSVNSVVHLHTYGTATVTDKNGKVVSQTNFGIPPEQAPKNKTTVDVIYKFKDWSGSENVISLCEQYLKEIESFISDGISRSFITG